MSNIIFQSTSTNQFPYHVELNISPEWQRYWETGQSCMALYQAISENILNKPYVDMPEYLLKTDDITIYHPNHDTAHAIRQAMNTQFFIEMVKLHGLEQYKQTVTMLTTEENEALKLAGFLFRAARTNELAGKDDPQNAKRSAELFREIAYGLGFDPSLITAFYHCIANTYAETSKLELDTIQSGFRGDEVMQALKLNLAKYVLHLSHHSDLVRCFNDVNRIADTNKENLTKLMNPDAVKDLSSITLDHARACCEATGTAYFMHNDAEDRRFPPLYFKARATINLMEAMDTVMQLSQQFIQTSRELSAAKAQALLAETQRTTIPPQPLLDPELIKQNNAAKTIQQAYVAHRAHQSTKQSVGIYPPATSKHNLSKLKRELQNGDGLLAEEKQQKGRGILLEQEQRLYDYLVHDFDWTLKHITPNYERVYKDNNTLKSLHRRSREARFNDVRHTSDFEGRSDNIYFTLAGPNGWPARFLHLIQGYEIRVPLRRFIKEGGLRLSGQLSKLWLSSAWYAINNGTNDYSRFRSDIASTRREVLCVKGDSSSSFITMDDYKIYHYRREDGTVLERKVSFSEETVTGAELLPFLAYHVILELRLIGGTYRQECLRDRSFTTIEPLVDHIFQHHDFEALLPSHFNLNDAQHIEVRPFNQGHPYTAKNATRMLAAVKSCSVEEIKAALADGVPIDIQLSNGKTPLVACITSPHFTLFLPIIRYLLQQGAYADIKGLNAYAVKNHLYDIVDLLLSTGIIDKRDPRIKRLYNINEDIHTMISAFTQGNQEMRNILKRHGCNFAQIPAIVLEAIIKLPELSALDGLAYIQEAGFNANSVSLFKESDAYMILKQAIVDNKYQVLQTLLDLGFNPNAGIKATEPSLLSLAELYHQPQIVQLLQRHHAMTPMVVSQTVQHTHLIVVNSQQQLLLARKRNTDSSMSRFLQSITFDGDLSSDLIHFMLFAATGIREDNLQHTIIHQGNNAIVIVNLAGKTLKPVQTEQWADCQWLPLADVRNANVDRLTCAFAQGVPALQLLELFNRRNALVKAIKTDDLSLVNTLLQQGVSDTEQTALRIACDTMQPNEHIIEALLDDGYDINTVYTFAGEMITPLMFAIMHHRLDLVALLLERGANVNKAIGGSEVTPMLLAAELNQLDTLALLQKKGGALNHPANRAILAYACSKYCNDHLYPRNLEMLCF